MKNKIFLKQIKKNKGITLIALVITIIILLILAGITIAMLTGENGILKKAITAKENNNKEAAMEKIKIAVMASFEQDGKFNENTFKVETVKQGGNIVGETDTHFLVEMDGYQTTVDRKTGEVGELNTKAPEPEIKVTQKLEGNIMKITVEVTNDVGKVDKIVVTNITNSNNETKVGEISNSKTGEFELTSNGTYKIEVTATTDGITKTTTKIIEVKDIPVEFSVSYGRIDVVWIDTDDEVIPTPNKPNLSGMTPVKWEGGTPITVNEDDPTWYDYKAKTGTEDNLESHWANAKNTINNIESYFVWIPRYAYRIIYYESETSDIVTGYCDGRGITSVNGTVQQSIGNTVKTVEANGKNYIVHPAFRDGTSNNFKNGEWDRELSGIWVGKFETAKNDATASSAGSGNNIKIVPGVQSWRNIMIGDCYTKSINYDKNKESHLMKNSEWGAVAYLAHSQYGRNGHEITINNSSNFITGNAANEISADVGNRNNKFL